MPKKNLAPTKPNHKDNSQTTTQPLIGHLIELRQRLLRALASVLIIFFPLYFFANEIYTFAARPLQKFLPEGATMIATEVASPFLIPLKLTLILAVFLAIPYILYQTWAFIAPGLYKHEKYFIIPLQISSVILFYTGVCFSYLLVLPLIFQFTISVVPEGVMVMTDINNYLDFILKLFFAFGIAFEIPIAILVLVRTGIITVAKLSNKRPYVIVICFCAGMLLTPPDIISQVLLALPMWILFELGVLVSRRVKPKKYTEDHPESS